MYVHEPEACTLILRHILVHVTIVILRSCIMRSFASTEKSWCSRVTTNKFYAIVMNDIICDSLLNITNLFLSDRTTSSLSEHVH